MSKAGQTFSVSNILGKGPADPKLEDIYTLDKQVGKGAFGVVKAAINKRTGEVLACKSISKAKLVCKEDVKDVQAEVAIMNLVAGHQNVVTLKVWQRARAKLAAEAALVARRLGGGPGAGPIFLRRAPGVRAPPFLPSLPRARMRTRTRCT